MNSKLLNPIPASLKRQQSEQLQVVLLVWVALMSLATFVVYRRGYFLNLKYPENSFLPSPQTRYSEFYGIYDLWQIEWLGNLADGPFPLPAKYLPVHLLYRFFGDDRGAALLTYQLTAVVSTALLIVLVMRRVNPLDTCITAVLIFLSYPYFFALHTGSFESLVVLLLLAATYFAHEAKWGWFGVSVGIATGISGFPMMFLIVPFAMSSARHGTRSLSAAMCVATSLNLVAVTLLPGGIRTDGFRALATVFDSIRESHDSYTEMMVNGSSGVQFGHSFLNAVHAFLGMDFMRPQLFGPLVFFSICLSGMLSLWCLKRICGDLAGHLFIIAAVTCLAPSASSDHRLLFLAPGILSFALAPQPKSKSTSWMLLLAVMAMAPKPYFRVGEGDTAANASVYLTALLLLAIIVLPIVEWRKIQRLHQSRGAILPTT